MDWQFNAQVATVFSAFVSAINVLGTLAILIFSLRLTQKSLKLTQDLKRFDILNDYNKRFADAWSLRAAPHIATNPILFYEQFWSIQRDQFRAWKEGLVGDADYQYWARIRYNDWMANKSFGSITYREGFDQVINEWTHTPFIDFIKHLHKHGADEAMKAFK